MQSWVYILFLIAFSLLLVTVALAPILWACCWCCLYSVIMLILYVSMWCETQKWYEDFFKRKYKHKKEQKRKVKKLAKLEMQQKMDSVRGLKDGKFNGDSIYPEQVRDHKD